MYTSTNTVKLCVNTVEYGVYMYLLWCAMFSLRLTLPEDSVLKPYLLKWVPYGSSVTCNIGRFCVTYTIMYASRSNIMPYNHATHIVMYMYNIDIYHITRIPRTLSVQIDREYNNMLYFNQRPPSIYSRMTTEYTRKMQSNHQIGAVLFALV